MTIKFITESGGGVKHSEHWRNGVLLCTVRFWEDPLMGI